MSCHYRREQRSGYGAEWTYRQAKGKQCHLIVSIYVQFTISKINLDMIDIANKTNLRVTGLSDSSSGIYITFNTT